MAVNFVNKMFASVCLWICAIFTAIQFIAMAIFGNTAGERWQKVWLYRTVILTRADENIADSISD